MKTVIIQCPAKINLTLKVVNKRPDGFHNIDSIMQTISLYDFLTITAEQADRPETVLSGNSTEIPYDKTNLVYKAAALFLKNSNLPPQRINIYIEKNIPVSAGLAGGSTDGAGTLFGLNEIFDKPLTNEELHKLCAKLGSDLNVCLTGGCLQTSGRGEVIVPAPYKEYNVRLIKPVTLGISAKEAYTKFSAKFEAGKNLQTRSHYKNDLEWAVIGDYEQLKHIKKKYPHAMMTGSGAAYFSLEKDFEPENGYLVINSLTTIPHGVRIC